jgi:hypothetical protein
LIAVLLCALTLAYMICAVAIPIPKERRLDVAELGILVLVTVITAMLCVPSFFKRVKSLKFPGGELELLERLQEDAQKNKQELDDIRFVLTLLLAPSELKHLRNLQSGETQKYHGGGSVRAELRKLRTLGLIDNQPDRAIGELDDGKNVDLARLVFLTERGKRYLDRLAEEK